MNKLVKTEEKVYLVRGEWVMLDRDLANAYKVEPKVFNKARKRKSAYFEKITFQLTKEEWVEILEKQGLKFSGGHTPWVYTQKAAYKMAFVLDSKTSLDVSDLILDVFLSVKEKGFSPLMDNKMNQLEKRIERIEAKIEGASITNHYHGHVLIGTNNQVIQNDSMLLEKLLEMKKEVGHDPMAEKMDDLIKVIKDGKKEKISAYVKKSNDAMDFLTKMGPAALVVKAAYEMVKVYFKF